MTAKARRPKARAPNVRTAAVLLLRGINVVGKNQIKMDALRALCESNGLRNVRTHIQSGNVIFRGTKKDISGCALRMEAAIEESFGFRPAVMIRSTEEMRKVVSRNPFAKRANIDPSRLLVSFLGKEPTREQLQSALAIEVGPEELHILGSEMYIYYPDGVGKSKLPIGRIERALETSGTARNWNTVTRLLEMALESEPS